jgi:hypothetical protein
VLERNKEKTGNRKDINEEGRNKTNIFVCNMNFCVEIPQGIYF